MYAQQMLKRSIYIFCFLIVFVYSIFKLYGLFSGPKVTIYYPTNGEKVDRVFTITGKAVRADKIYLFDREIFTDDTGYFKEVMVGNTNYTDVKIKATNRWGKETDIKLTVENIENNGNK